MLIMVANIINKMIYFNVFLENRFHIRYKFGEIKIKTYNS